MSPSAGKADSSAAALRGRLPGVQEPASARGAEASPSAAAPGSPRLAMVAGEPSGDNLGATIAAALSRHAPAASIYGIGGPRMQDVGVRSLFPMEKLSVMGYAEALRSLPEILAIRRRLRRMLREDPPDAFVGIDAPDFNLGLERDLRAAGVPTVHVVSPTVWAWRAGRMAGIRRAVSHMLTLFPFETGIYEKAGIPVTYIGHPRAASLPSRPDRGAARDELQLPRHAPTIALLPGSRRSELRFLGELYVETAHLIARELPGVQFVAPLATRETREMFEQTVRRRGGGSLPLKLMFGHADKAMAAADVVLVASGTASLEAALLGRPMVITYRISPLTYRYVRRRIYLPYVGMPNILAGEFVAPELLQDDATAENLAQALLNLLHDGAVRTRTEARLATLHRELQRDTGTLAAQAILAVARRG